MILRRLFGRAAAVSPAGHRRGAEVRRRRRRPHRAWRRLAASLLASVAAAAGGEEFATAARVNGVAISSERLERYREEVVGGRDFLSLSNPERFRRQEREALDQLVEQELLWQEAQRLGQVAPQEEVQAALGQLRERFASDGALASRLERAGFTLPAYREYLLRLLSIRRLVERVIASGLAVSEEEVRAQEAGAQPAGGVSPPHPGPSAGESIRQRLLAEKVRRAVADRVRALRAQARIEVSPSL